MTHQDAPQTSARLTPGQAGRTTWQTVQAEILSRIRNRYYAPGGLIPTEHELAAEFGCARATVSRALGELASRGVLERRRKVGTRVAETMEQASTLNTPTLSQTIKQSGRKFSHQLLTFEYAKPPSDIRTELAMAPVKPPCARLICCWPTIRRGVLSCAGHIPKSRPAWRPNSFSDPA